MPVDTYHGSVRPPARGVRRRGKSENGGGRSSTDGGESSDEEKIEDVSEFGPAEFRREAEEFAADHEEEGFDFTVESLERLDEYAASQVEVLGTLDGETDDGAGVAGKARDGYMLWFGSYFGEVVVRQFDGEWVTDGDGVTVPAGDSFVEVPPMDAAAVAVEGDPQFATMAAELQEEAERAERGVDPNPDVSGDGDRTGPPIPAVDLEPGTDLDAAHQRAVEAFDEAEFYVTEGNI